MSSLFHTIKSDLVFVKIVNFLKNYTDVIYAYCKQNNVYINEAIGFDFMCSLLTHIYIGNCSKYENSY